MIKFHYTSWPLESGEVLDQVLLGLPASTNAVLTDRDCAVLEWVQCGYRTVK